MAHFATGSPALISSEGESDIILKYKYATSCSQQISCKLVRWIEGRPFPELAIFHLPERQLRVDNRVQTRQITADVLLLVVGTCYNVSVPAEEVQFIRSGNKSKTTMQDIAGANL